MTNKGFKKIASLIKRPVAITVDDREAASGIVELLQKCHWEVRVRRLAVGDYRLGRNALIERKAAHDFALSIIDGRLFRQASRLKKQGLRAVILVEGSPFRTGVGIDHEAVRGALVSVSLDLAGAGDLFRIAAADGGNFRVHGRSDSPAHRSSDGKSRLQTEADKAPPVVHPPEPPRHRAKKGDAFIESFRISSEHI